jgi:hypothetical protein
MKTPGELAIVLHTHTPGVEGCDTYSSDGMFIAKFYDRRASFEPLFRKRVEREAKARGLRNIQRRDGT